jgi:hypothetical protein
MFARSMSLRAESAIYVQTVAIFESLWPAIGLHCITDAANGVIAWLVLRQSR